MSDFLETLKARRAGVLKEAQRAIEAYDIAIAREESLLKIQTKETVHSVAQMERADDDNSGSPSKAGLILNAVRTAGTNGVTLNDLDSQLKVHGVKRQYIHTVMFKLINERHQVQKRRNRYYLADASLASQPAVLQ